MLFLLNGMRIARGELVAGLKSELRELSAAGHEIGSHGQSHRRPLTVSPQEFGEEIRRCRLELEDTLGRQGFGFRAPCFSLDRERLQQVIDQGFAYDSSRIQFSDHPLYGTLNLDGFAPVSPWIHRLRGSDFFEFEMSTLAFGGKQLPVSGGGYLRIFPWLLMKRMIGRYLNGSEFYILYIHTSELSEQNNPPYPEDVRFLQKRRFETGRGTVARKIRRLIELLKHEQFEFNSFENLRARLLTGDVSVSPAA